MKNPEVHLKMKKNSVKVMITKENGSFSEKRKCGVITCIHCINDRCTSNKCDMFENQYIQEG